MINIKVRNILILPLMFTFRFKIGSTFGREYYECKKENSSINQLYMKLGTRAKSSLNRDFYVLFSTFFPNQAEIMIWMENWWFENGSPIFQYGAYVRIIKTLWSHIKYFFIRETFDQYVHWKCLQGFTGTLRGNRSAGISNLRELHVYPQFL